MKIIILLLGIIGALLPARGQTLQGKITDTKGDPLLGASIVWVSTSIGSTTNDKGEFEITLENIREKKLVISFVGYKTDTVTITKETFILHKLNETKTLNEVTVTA